MRSGAATLQTSLFCSSVLREIPELQRGKSTPQRAHQNQCNYKIPHAVYHIPWNPGNPPAQPKSPASGDPINWRTQQAEAQSERTGEDRPAPWRFHMPKQQRQEKQHQPDTFLRQTSMLPAGTGLPAPAVVYGSQELVTGGQGQLIGFAVYGRDEQNDFCLFFHGLSFILSGCLPVKSAGIIII